MDIRERLLDAAVRVFAEMGYRGATTRRIAREANVNEVTIFRNFGSKDALLRQALQRAAEFDDRAALPAKPVNPERELTRWARARFAHLFAARALIRKVISECEAHPEMASCAARGPNAHACDLSGYLVRLREAGLATADFDPASAATMLMGALFAEAMSRDVMPEMYRRTVDAAIAQYVRLLLRGIGVAVTAKSTRTRRRHAA